MKILSAGEVNARARSLDRVRISLPKWIDKDRQQIADVIESSHVKVNLVISRQSLTSSAEPRSWPPGTRAMNVERTARIVVVWRDAR
jgi:hypothetical protein